MSQTKTILITGAAGNLGSKLRRHLEGRYPLRLLDIQPHGDPAITQADLSQWDPAWVSLFEGVDTVVHLAADPQAHQTWANLVKPNIDALVNVFAAAAQAGVQRVVYASSNHVMGGYKELDEPAKITTDLPPRPGTRYCDDSGKLRDSTAYGGAKLMGERIGKCYADIHGLSCIAVRIGWVRPGENRAADIPLNRPWFRLMWLSNRDFCQLMEKCILADPAIQFAIVNGMSNNTGMRWDIEYTRQLVGYEPQDDVTRGDT